MGRYVKETTVITEYHAKHFGYELNSLHSVAEAGKLAGKLFDPQVDIRPPQFEAALLGIRSPLSKGANVADEVRLGKITENGFLLLQKWTNAKHRNPIVTPASLRKQWSQKPKEESPKHSQTMLLAWK